jgi:agmatinase
LTTQYRLNANLEILLREGRTHAIRAPLLGTQIRGTPYQVQLLDAFVPPGATLDAVLERFPAQGESSRAFLHDAVEAGVLLDAARADELPTTTAQELTWLRAPRFSAASPAAFALLGVPWDRTTTGRPGARFGPQALRAAAEGTSLQVSPDTLSPVGLVDFATGQKLLEGISVADAGDVFVNPAESLDVGFARVTDAVRELVSAGSIPLVIGGDHAITHPVLRAVADQPLVVVHLDAHTDLGDVNEQLGLHHGNVFSVVLDEMKHVEHVFQVGLRGVYDAPAGAKVDDVTQIGVDRLRRDGVDAIVSLVDADLPVYLSIDIDVLDPSFAPATGTPVAGGLTPAETRQLVRAVCERREVLGVDVVEVCEPTGPADGTAYVAHELLVHAADGIVAGMRARMGDEEA